MADPVAFCFTLEVVASYIRPVPPETAMSDILHKNWDRAFSKNREIKENWSRSFVDQKRDERTAGEGIEIFLQDTEDSGLDDRVVELKAFTAPVPLLHLKQGTGSAGLRHGAWLDERSITSEKRNHKNPLTATQLCQRRQIPVCNS